MTDYQTDFEKYLVSEYFKHGSINKVFYFHHFGIPISYAGYDRILTKYHVIKSAGPNSKLTESLRILSLVADYKLSLEKIYEKYAPHRLLVSTNTLHRILHYIRLGLTRRQGVALIITNHKKPDLFLTGHDLTLSNPSLGHKGDLSLPMGHSKIGESPRDSILRVLQQEAFTDLVINKSFPYEIIPEHPKPSMYINIADIKVAVYHLNLTDKYPLSSFKLTGFKYRSYEEIFRLKSRPGIHEILNKYLELRKNTDPDSIPEFDAELNTRLYAMAAAPIEAKP